jgi:uncharacterized membrane protein YidH (DUF202 family)
MTMEAWVVRTVAYFLCVFGLGLAIDDFILDYIKVPRQYEIWINNFHLEHGLIGILLLIIGIIRLKV